MLGIARSTLFRLQIAKVAAPMAECGESLVHHLFVRSAPFFRPVFFSSSGLQTMRIASDPNDKAVGGNVIGGDPNTFHPRVWSFLAQRFSIRSALDVGCGEGHCVRHLFQMGIPAFGFDGLFSNIGRAVFPIAFHDLRVVPFVMPVDLVHCCEVVEHIEEQFLDNLLATLANGRVIAMTHALPGQGGYHHVNCQPSEYWIKHIEAIGYNYLHVESEELRNLGSGTEHWTYFSKSGLVFERM